MALFNIASILYLFLFFYLQACNDYVEVSSTAGRKWQRLLQHERDQRVRLEDMVEQLARQHSHLEQEAKEQMSQAMPPGMLNMAQQHHHISNRTSMKAETCSDICLSW